MAKKGLKAEFKSYKNFLLEYNYSFSIPYYQREFIWSLEENKFVLKKFIRDIAEQFDECKRNNYEKSYFIGNFATCSNKVNSIVDGQQRLTTMTILLKMLSNYTKSNNKNYFYSGNSFLISDNGYLANNLEHFLFGKNGVSFDVNGSIKLSIDIIEEEVKKLVKKYSTQDLKDFEDYVLNNVYLTYIEFDNDKDALKYYLNINSLSVPLTEMEVFYAFTSQVIQFTTYNVTVEAIKANLNRIDEKIKQLSDEDLVYLFLKTYFKDDGNIGSLNDKKSKTGVGRWLSGYKMEILSDPTKALDFIQKLTYYINDVEEILSYLTGTKSGMVTYKHIHLNYLINNYSKNRNIKEILLALFLNRHNYNDVNIYKKGTLDIDPILLESFCKAANAVMITKYFNGNKKDEKTNLIDYTVPRSQANFTVANIGYANLRSLNYPTERQDLKYKIEDNQHEIHFILALQEAFLNYTANPVYSLNSLLSELLNTNTYTIEHLFTKKDFIETKRRDAWDKKGLFDETNPAKYDEIRSSFKNLSLLDRNTNSSLSSNTISLKLTGYANARSITSSNEPEYLVQSFVAGSDFYKNDNIQKLNLPERVLKIDNDGITWEHSDNNDKFIEMLSRLAVKELFK